MSIKSLDELKKYFERGDRPTEDQFEMLIDSLSVNTTGSQENIKTYHQIIPDVAVKKISTESNSGDIYLTSNPQISIGVDGQLLILYGSSDNDYVTLVDGNGLILTDELQLKNMVTLLLIFLGSEQKWLEVARHCGGSGGGTFNIDALPETFTASDSDFLAINNGTNQYKITKANFLSSIGGTFNLTIQDEGSDILTSVDTINFTGVDVEVISDGAKKVNVFIPPPDYVSHFSTNDGTTNATLNNVSTFNRYVSLPTSEGSPFKIGDWNGNSLRNVLNSHVLSFSTVEEFSIINNTDNSIEVKIIDADESSTIISHQEIITGNLDVTLNNIRIQITNFTVDANRYKAKASFEIDIDQILAVGGRFTIQIKNDTITDGIYTFTQGPLFYDPNVNTASLSTLSFSETIGNIQTKQLSGVFYYNINSYFTVGINNIDYLNDRSYPSIQVQINGSDYGLSQLDLYGSDLTDWNKQFDDINDSYQKTDWILTQTNFFTQSSSAKVQARTIDWVNSSWIDSAVQNIIIDTFSNNNLSNFEDFRNELKRYQSDLTTLWDSSIKLNLIDSNTGLQIKNSKLIYPKEDFTIYYPNPTQQPDYTTLINDRVYYSYFFHTGTSHSNGLFRLLNHNLTEAILTNKDVIIKISLDGLNWFILNDVYLGGSLNDGDGCRINPGVYNLTSNNEIEFTLGTGGFTDASTGQGWGIWYKIIYKDNSIGRSLELGSIEIINWI